MDKKTIEAFKVFMIGEANIENTDDFIDRAMDVFQANIKLGKEGSKALRLVDYDKNIDKMAYSLKQAKKEMLSTIAIIDKALKIK